MTEIEWAVTGHGGQSHIGSVGGIDLFQYTWDAQKAHPDQPWAMWSALPGHAGKRWRGKDEAALRELAPRVLDRWLAKAQGLGTHEAEAAACEGALALWLDNEPGPDDPRRAAIEGFVAGWQARARLARGERPL